MKKRSIEDIIIDQAAECGFILKLTIYPGDLPCCGDTGEAKDMEDAGAAIFIFQNEAMK
jgi:hypothetical protein